MASATLADPIFRLRTRKRNQLGSLFDVMACAADGTLIDLPSMQAHQRAPIVTALAVMMRAIELYATHPLTMASDWRGEWERQIGVEALRLVAPTGERAFFQPPTSGEPAEITIEEVDRLTVAQRHAVKPQRSTTPERAAFALMSSDWRQYGGVGWTAGCRPGITAVLVGDGQTLASEIMALIVAYRHMPSKAVGERAQSNSAADHLLWLATYDATVTSTPVEEVPYPFLSARTCRLVERDDGLLGAMHYRTKTKRLIGGDDMGDPQVAMSEGKPFKAISGRLPRSRFLHRTIFGDGEVQRPRVLDLAGDYRMVRVCAIHTDKASTGGYREVTLAATRRRGGFHMGPPDEDQRPAELSTLGLETVSRGVRRCLWPAVLALHEENAENQPKTQTVCRNSEADLELPVLQWVIDRLQEPRDIEGEAASIEQVVAHAVRRAFDIAVAATPRSEGAYRRIAEAEGSLDWRISEHLKGGATEMTFDPPQLGRRIHAALGEIAAHLTPQDKARLRSMAMEHPTLTYWEILAAVPESLSSAGPCDEAWRVIAKALGHLALGGHGFGRALAEAHYPEMRMDRLLAATGDALRGQVADALRWLETTGTSRVRLSDVAVLMLADGISDAAVEEYARRRVALDYVRAARKQQVAR